MISMNQILPYIPTLKHFISPSQLQVIGDACRGEEREWFKSKLNELGNLIKSMPGPYGQDGKGQEAIAYLHYFKDGMDFYITERDSTDEQYQAYGRADLGWGAEMGYICIEELLRSGVELDLHFEPTPLNKL